MKKKLTLVVTSVLLVAALVIGGTLAYFTDTTEDVKNTFTMGNVDIDLTETSVASDKTADQPALKAGTANNNNGFDYGALAPDTYYAKKPVITVQNGSQDAWVFLELKMDRFVSLVNLMGVDAYANDVMFPTLTGDYPGFGLFVQMLADKNNNDLRAAVLGRWFIGINHSDWTVMNLDEIESTVREISQNGNQAGITELRVVLGYKETRSAGDSATFMTGFGMPSTVTNSMMNGDDAYKVGDDKHSASNFQGSNMTFKGYAIQADGLTSLQAAYEAMFK